MRKHLFTLFVCLMFQSTLVLSGNGFIDQVNNLFAGCKEQSRDWYDRASNSPTFAPKVRAGHEYLNKKDEHEELKKAYQAVCADYKARVIAVAALQDVDNNQDDLMKMAIQERNQVKKVKQQVEEAEKRAFEIKQHAWEKYVAIEKPSIVHAAEIAIPGLLGLYLYKQAVGKTVVHEGVKYVYKAGWLKKNFLKLAIPTAMLQGYVRSEIIDKQTRETKKRNFEQAVQAQANKCADKVIASRQADLNTEREQHRNQCEVYRKSLQDEQQKALSNKDEECARAIQEQQQNSNKIAQDLRVKLEQFRKNHNQQKAELAQRDNELQAKNKEIALKQKQLEAFEEDCKKKGWWHKTTGKPLFGEDDQGKK